LNNAKNQTTGYSPFYLFYGREAVLPLDLSFSSLTGARNIPAAAEELARWRRALIQAKTNTINSQKRQKYYADKKRRAVEFKVGDKVLLATANLKLVGETRRARKFTERYSGPYRVKKVINRNAYELELPRTLKIHPVINISNLKEYHDGVEKFPDRPLVLNRPDPVAVEDSGSPIFEVDKILDHRKIGNKHKRIQYLVSWKGYPIHEATWEPIENLDGALESVIDYNQKKKIDLGVIVTVSKMVVEQSKVNRNQVNNNKVELTSGQKRLLEILYGASVRGTWNSAGA
jgi:hypothetical protein